MNKTSSTYKPVRIPCDSEGNVITDEWVFTPERLYSESHARYLGGLIAGDLIGSAWEGQPAESGRPLLTPDSAFTDETAVALSALEALEELQHESNDVEAFTKTFREKLKPRRDAGFSADMVAWIDGEPVVIDLEGNGAAIRAAAIMLLPGHDKRKLTFARSMIRQTHSEEATSLAMMYARVFRWNLDRGNPGKLLAELIEEWPVLGLYDPDVFKRAGFDSTLWWTLPPALHIGLKAESYDDMFEQVLAIGGDTDSIGAMAGAIGHKRWGLEGLPVDVSQRIHALREE